MREAWEGSMYVKLTRKKIFNGKEFSVNECIQKGEEKKKKNPKVHVVACSRDHGDSVKGE